MTDDTFEDALVILIDRRLTYAAKRCTLVHELTHWRHGDASCGHVARSREEHRARRETALTLIDPLHYGLLEQMYDGNSWNIAQELEVTQQVLGDFRQIMAEHVCITFGIQEGRGRAGILQCREQPLIA